MYGKPFNYFEKGHSVHYRKTDRKKIETIYNNREVTKWVLQNIANECGLRDGLLVDML